MDNDNQQPDNRIRFGPLPHQTMPAEWATAVLEGVFRDNRPLFARLMRQAFLAMPEVAKK
jgi:hypothetical protein